MLHQSQKQMGLLTGYLLKTEHFSDKQIRHTDNEGMTEVVVELEHVPIYGYKDNAI